MNGFHNSFDRYCEWCDEQVEAGLPTMNWGRWWDEVAEREEEIGNLLRESA